MESLFCGDRIILQMKKTITKIICLLLPAMFIAGCISDTGSSVEPAAVVPATETAAPETGIVTVDLQVPDPTPEGDGIETETTTPEPETAPDEPEDTPVEEGSHYVFQPKVTSAYLKEVFGETMCETWFNLVDAVMAGESTFACPDQHTYNWVMGQFPDKCFPVLTELIDYAWDREHSVVDGVASFTYLVPQEEAAERIADFAKLVEDILNEALEDDYSDFEKAFALYQYFYRHYEYDYEAYELMYEKYVDYLSSYRLLTEKKGVCAEISVAYAYLLMQAGVDAGTMGASAHEWSYVRIEGHDYHIDPTFVLGTEGSLAYFMMDDDQREWEGYPKSEQQILSNYSQDHPHPEYAADDKSFEPLWKGFEAEMDHASHTLHYWFYGPGWERLEETFDYQERVVTQSDLDSIDIDPDGVNVEA